MSAVLRQSDENLIIDCERDWKLAMRWRGIIEYVIDSEDHSVAVTIDMSDLSDTIIKPNSVHNYNATCTQL